MVVAPEMEPAVDLGHAVVRDFLRVARRIAARDPHGVLAELESTLPLHFAWEEKKAGFLETLSAIRIATVVADRFRAEHTEFRLALAELRAAADRGDEVAADVQQLVDRVRAHERLESAAALRLQGTPPAGVVRMPAAAQSELSPIVAAVVERLANEALGQQRDHDGILSFIRVGIPAGAPVDTYLDALEHDLSERGIDFVDIETEICEGPACIMAMRFEPGWGQ